MPKKLKDENAPKRPLSSYMMWSQSAREQLAKEVDSDLEGRDKSVAIMKLAGAKWKEMSDGDKEKWEAKAAKAKKKYTKAMDAYKQTDEYAEFQKMKVKHNNKSALKAVAEPEGKPKRPASGYMRFMAKERPKIVADGFEGIGDIGKEAGRRWGALSDAKKDKFQQAYRDEMEDYNKDIEEWKATDEYAEYQEELKAVRQKIKKDAKRRRSEELSSEEAVERPKKRAKTSKSRSKSKSKSRSRSKSKGKGKSKLKKAKGKRSRSRSKSGKAKGRRKK